MPELNSVEEDKSRKEKEQKVRRADNLPIPLLFAITRHTDMGSRRPSVFVSASTFPEHWLRRYVMGDCPAVSVWVDSWEHPIRWILRFLESLLRTFGALIFVNNFWSGILFLVAVFIHNPFSTLIGLLGMVTAYFTAMLLCAPASRLRNGVATFNGFMVAQFIANVAVPFNGTIWNAWLIFPASFFAAISTVIKAAFHSVLKDYKLPALNSPFSITTLCFLASQGSTPSPLFPAGMSPVAQYNNYTQQHYTGSLVARGIFFSISNIYGCDNIASVTLAWLAVLLASPLLFTQCILGSCVGTGIAVVLGVNAQQLASGMWSFNSLLVCGSVGGFFYVWNPIICIVSIFAAAFACVMAGTLYHTLGYFNLPFQALPLFLTDSIFLLAVGAYRANWLPRVETVDIRYPELHWELYHARKKISNSTATITNSTTDSTIKMNDFSHEA
ncbi:urea transporter 2-like [Paramacrobiotus metropolitanus]|uniref:urea transporter 2-like n=1 Tax=Paramacrobiotus metropolitanus TaxID=2943436 RepID=UPI002445D581|nr:urea transporter 2-like [Paramacrobiotus metropolitanus]